MKPVRIAATLAVTTAMLTSLSGAPAQASRTNAPLIEQHLCGQAPAVPSNIPFGNTVRTDDPETGDLEVEALCTTGAHAGWTIRAVLHREGGSQAFASPRPFPFTEPIAILAVYYFARSELPAVLAQVGVGMTGQPYELFTFDNHHHVVPARIQFTSNFGALFGGGAALHGQGVYCGTHNELLVVTQLRWNIAVPFRMVPFDGGQTPAPTDRVTVTYEEWTLAGQPLYQVDRRSLPTTKTTYRKAGALEDAHC